MLSDAAREVICWTLSPADANLATPPFDGRILGTVIEGLRAAWQVLPLTIDRFEAWLDPAAEDTAEVADLRDMATAVRLYSALLSENCAEVSRTLREHGVAHSFLKGSALRYQLYGEAAELRCGEDIDLAVYAEDLAQARSLLQRLGFQPAQWNEARFAYVPGNPLLRALVEKQHYQLGFLVSRQRVNGLQDAEIAAITKQLTRKPPIWTRSKTGGLAANVMVDVHHGLTREISAQQLLDERRTIEFGDTAFDVPSFGWSMFHAIFKLYWEGVHTYDKGVYSYADICRLAPLLSGQDVAELEHLLSQWKLDAAAYYVLRRLPEQFGTPIPEPLKPLMERAAVPDLKTEPRTENDFGDVWMKLWGMR
jgi:GNAT superfamily N-acetyltransferase